MRKISLTALALSALVACSGGNKGCACAEPIKGGFPTMERHEGAIQLRATKDLFAFLSAMGPQLVPQLLGGSMFNVPPQCGSNKVCCATPPPMCRLEFDFKSLTLTPTAPNQLKLSTDLTLKTLDNLPVEFSGTKCVVSIDTTRSGSPTMNVSSTISFPVDKTTDTTGITTNGSTAVNNLDAGDLNVDESGSDFLCAVANFIPGIKDFIISQVSGQVAGQVDKTLMGQTCMKCMDKSDCNSFAADCKMGVCVQADGKTCVQEVGLDGRLRVGALLASIAPGNNAALDVLAVLGGWASADTGLSLGMLGGGLPDPHSPCVPQVAPPKVPTVPESKTFTTDVLPDGATPYHLGIGVHKSYLDQVGWAAFDSGALCLSVGTPTVALLTAKTLGVVISSLADLVHGHDAPMFLVVRPQKPPTFTLGKGTFATDAMGMKQIDDALLHVAVPDFHLDFYAFVDERYVRIMTLNADLAIPVSLDVDASGKIVPLLGDLSKAFPMLLGLAGGQIASVLKPIALPAIMGLNLAPKAITSTDPDADGQNQFLSIFADIAPATSKASIGVHTDARLDRLILPPTSEFSVAGRSERVPTAILDVSGSSALDGAPLEFQWQLDGTGWSAFTPETRLTLTHPVLWLQGRHKVEVRARAQGAPESLDLHPAELELLVDTVAPTVRLIEDTSAVRAVAEDNVSATEALLYRWRLAGGSVTDWSSEPSVPLSRGPIVAEVRDEAGNVGSTEFHGRTTDPPKAGGCGCDLGGASQSEVAGTSGIVAIALFGLLLARRRLRLLLLLAGLVAGCNDTLGKGDFENPVDEVGRWNDVVANNGVFHVSAYDDSVGDLVYARITDLAQPIGWQYVDGLDPVSTDGPQPAGYRHGVTDPGPDVGQYTSIALTKSGSPRISYYDVTNNALKYAAQSGRRFTSHTVQAGSQGVLLGLFTALSLDDNDVPTIAFMVTGIADGKGAFKSELRVAVAKGPQPASDGDWTISTVDSTSISCAGRCSSGQACIQAAMVNGMPNGDPSKSTCTPVDAAPCKSMCSDTQACIQGKCTAFLAPPKAPELPDGTGLFTSAHRGQGALTLVYYDHAQGDLKMASGSAGSFKVGFIDGNDPSTDVGQFAAAQLADDGTLHVVYQDALADRVLYKTVQNGAAAKMPEVVDDGVRDDGLHPVGAGLALVLDGGVPRAVYQDQALSDVDEAKRMGNWSHSALRTGIPGYGWWPHLVSDGGKLYLSQLVYDRENGSGALASFSIAPLDQ